MMFHQSITRLRAPAVSSPYGDEVRDWTDPDRLIVGGVHVQPLMQSEEFTSGRNPTVTGWRVYTPAGMDLDLVASDRVEFDGIVCEVDGEVARWPDPITPGVVHHVEVTIQRAEG